MRMFLLVGSALCVAAGSVKGVKDTRFFKVDFDQQAIVGAAAQVEPALKLDLIGATTDQPQYWPNEKVYLKVLALGAGGSKVTAKLQKRDAQATSIELDLDAQGIGVVEIMNGEQKRLELGEYRVDIELKTRRSSTTFTVVEGTLGALSLAHEFKKVTSPQELETAKGAWFLGNAAGAGKRWGNGLSFKNELRLDNKPFSGEVDIHSRCMLSGCNGTYAGKSLLAYRVEGGTIAGTLDVGGHSGPFQIEVVSKRGSLRHQFEGSSHVERDMIPISGGLHTVFSAGLAPYEKTKQVPGRQIFVEANGGGNEAFDLASVIAQQGHVTVKVLRKMKGVTAIAYAPKPDGTFQPNKISKGDSSEGSTFTVDVGDPYSFIALGGFVDGNIVESWAIAFAPSQLEVGVSAPEKSGPLQQIAVTVTAKDASGKPAKVSGILEAYDNRVSSKSALQPIASAIGDGFRNVSSAVSSWRDNTGIDHAEADEEKAEDKMMAPSPTAGMSVGGGARSAPMAMPKPSRAYKKSKGHSGGSGLAPANSAGGGGDDEDGPDEAIREGERKVVLCQRIETDANGTATAQMTLPPQLGRVNLRFVAVRGLDHAVAQKSVDLLREAAAELRLPTTFVPGAKLTLPVSVTNTTKNAVDVSVSGPGLQSSQTRLGPGDHTFDVAWAPLSAGKVIVETRNAQRLVDRREIKVAPVSEQPVTYSRLDIAEAAMTVAPDETAMVYATAGELLNGMVMNVFTTMESWFGHAEALSAKVAASSVVFAAISQGLLKDDGMRQNVIAAIDKSTRDLEEAFFDKGSSLVRPYPGTAPNPVWSGWVSSNLHTATRALARAQTTDARITQTVAALQRMTSAIDAELKKRGLKADEQFGFDAQGNAVIPVEIDGKVVYRVLTDDSVTRWAASKLVPAVAMKGELDFSKAYDTFRFLRAFERVGALQYLTDVAHALWLKGDMASFLPLYRTLTRGMILAQEPGMLQGPAMLGGVYSTPMALVRFLELQLDMGIKAKAAPLGTLTFNGKSAKFGERLTGGGTLNAPAGAMVRLDRAGVVRFSPSDGGSFAKGGMSLQRARAGKEIKLHVELDPSRDPLEYYALIAVPSTTAIKQTNDILSDYRGQLIYGQQTTGSSQIQLLAVPFRGSRSVDLTLEATHTGTSPGLLLVRHIENPALVSTTALPAVVTE